MKRIFWMSLFGLAAAVLGGCPIYPDNGNQRVCGGNGCYNCPDPYYSDSCSAWQCNYDSDCPNNYSCVNNQCISGGYDSGAGGCTQPSDCASGQNCGSDGQCHSGDCSNSGCPSGFQCKLSGGTLQCIGSTTRDGGAGDGSNGDSSISGCLNDTQCASLGAGAKCLDGVCTRASDTCFDGTQCPSNDQCVSGVCTPACDATHACPTGYSCDANGVCTGNPTPCGSGTEMCTGGTTCVDQHCVPPCGVGDTCTTGLICVQGGCIPDQKPQFVCGADGSVGDGLPGDCAVGSLCLHHSCYIACTPNDGGAGDCRAADKFNICKSVAVSGTSYNVCGSSTNLGSDCDPTQGKNCDAGVCIDGYCR
jgi:hypothetical protein